MLVMNVNSNLLSYSAKEGEQTLEQTRRKRFQLHHQKLSVFKTDFRKLFSKSGRKDCGSGG